jgi:hypothetical protein
MVHKKSITENKYGILFAIDGKHFQKLKIGTFENTWDYFNFDKNITEQRILNPRAKFRYVNLSTGKVIGEK